MVQGGGQEGDQSYGFPERQVEVGKVCTGQEKPVFGEGGPGSGVDSTWVLIWALPLTCCLSLSQYLLSLGFH